MPNGDKTGPNGKGPQTGKGLGKAVGNEKGRGLAQPAPKNSGANRGNGAGTTKKSGKK